MELRQLTYFTAVVRHGGFTRAAEHLRIAQPAISAQVRRLEAELGVTLLRRTTRRVELTRAGEVVLARAHAVLDDLAALRADVARLADVLTGQVRIGAIEAVGPMDLPAALAAFHRTHPGVDLTLRSGRRAELLADLDADRIDLAVAPPPTEAIPRIAARVLFSEELVLVTAPGRRAVTLGELVDEAFVCLPADSGLRALLDGACAAAGFAPRVRFEAGSLARVRELAAHGLGAALMARSVAEGPGAPVAVHPVRPAVRRAVALLHRADRTLSAAAAACHAALLDGPDVPGRPRGAP